MKKIRLVVVIALALVACALLSNTTPVSLRWLHRQPCAPPCWEGIVMGQTTVESAIALLRNNPAVVELVHHFDKFQAPWTGGSGEVRWRWRDQQYAPDRGDVSGGGNWISFTDSYTHAVTRMSFFYPSRFELGEVVDTYGEPSHVYALTSDRLGETVGILRLIYLSEGFAVESLIPKTDFDSRIGPTLRFHSVEMFWPAIRESLPQALVGGLRNIAVWQGMESFRFYCRQTSELPSTC